MKRLPLLLLLLCCETGSTSARTEWPDLKLRGIIDLPGYKGALLEYYQANKVIPHFNYLFLGEGQRADKLEVALIDAQKGVVQFKPGADQPMASLSLAATAASNTSGHPAIQLQKASLPQVVELYGMLAQRTLLVPPNLPMTPMTVQATASDSTDAASVIVKALKEKGVLVIPDGGKFTMIVPESMKSVAVPRSTEIRPSAQTQTSSTDHIIPAGELDLWYASVDQVLDLYLRLVNRQLDSSAPLPPIIGEISLKTHNPLTIEEVIYALDTLLAWHNLKLVCVGKDLARLEWISPPR